MTYQKLENSIRRDNKQISNNNRTKICIPFKNIYNERTESIDYHKVSIFENNNSNPKRRLSSSTSSNISQNQMDEFDDDDISSYMSLRQRRYYVKNQQRLPPMVKATITNRQKRKSKNQYWMTNFQQSKKSKENPSEPFTILLEESSSPNLPEPTPLQRQVRSFLNTITNI